MSKEQMGDKKKTVVYSRTNFQKGTPNQRVQEMLARYYLELKGRLCKGAKGNFMSMSYEDIFHNAILKTIQNSKASDVMTDQEIIALFEKVYASTEFQVINDYKSIHPLPYAYHQQADEKEE